MMIDVTTEAGALRFCELRRAEMARVFEKKGTFAPNGFSLTGYVFLTHEVKPPADPWDLSAWRTGPKLPAVHVERIEVPPAAARLMHDNGRDDLAAPMLGQTMRHYCKLGRAVGAVIMTEEWTGKTSSFEEREARPKRIEDWDDRAEALCMRLEHIRCGRRLWRADITRNPTRLGPWRPLAAVVIGGRIGDLMDQVEWAS